MDGWMDRGTDECVGGWRVGRLGWMAEGMMDGWLDGWMDVLAFRYL